MKSAIHKPLGFKTQFRLLIGTLAVCFVAYVMCSLVVLNGLEVNGPLYKKIALSKDLTSDVLPPPEYVIESYLVCFQLVEASAAEQQRLIDRLKMLKKDYDDRHRYWERQSLNPDTRQALLGQANAAALSFYQTVFNDLIPAVQRADRLAAIDALASISREYEVHRKAIDRVVQLARMDTETVEAKARQGIWAGFLLLCAVFVLAVVSSVFITRCLTTLNRQLEAREAKIRRLVDADIIGIFIWELESIIEANDAFLRIVGCEREDLVSGRVRWTDLTPPEWLDRDLRHWLPELKRTGRLQPFEKELFRKGGGRVPVLIGAASFEAGGNQGVAFVLDLTESKRAEAEARESERSYREIQSALAHANRVTTMGQLTASISHEIKQPIVACATNAEAGLRWLSARSPNLEEVRQALERITKDARRASEVVNRIHGLVRKTPTCMESVQINEAIREVIALARGEAEKSRVSVRMELAEELPLVQGDRVQLQQLMLNLTINAIEAMSAMNVEPRELTISTAVDEPGGVLVAMCDSGPGVFPENIERLFEPFYTTKTTGLGMGLSICRSIAEAHGGRLWVSANVPRGAIFQFTVPVLPAVAA
ncbi:sensor histidine kinase [Burkholderia sp. PU8-34]